MCIRSAASDEKSPAAASPHVYHDDKHNNDNDNDNDTTTTTNNDDNDNNIKNLKAKNPRVRISGDPRVSQPAHAREADANTVDTSLGVLFHLILIILVFLIFNCVFLKTILC